MKTFNMRRRLPLAAAIAFAAVHAHAATVLVDSNDDSAATTSCNMREAVAAMNNGANTTHCINSSADPFGTNDTINFAPALANATIALTQGVLGFVGGPVVTINGSGQVLDGQNNSGVLSLITSTVTASNLTFTHGNAPAPGGGGIYTTGSTLTLDHCLIDSNTATGFGGGIYLLGSSVATLTNSVISNNTLTCTGHCTAGAFASKSTLKLIASTVSGNQATGSGATPGYISGGLYNYSGTLSLHDSTVSGNTASGGIAIVGGIYSWSGTTFLVNSTVAGNSATGNNLVAGGIAETHYSTAPQNGITLTNTTVSSNYASNPAGAATHIAGGIVLGTWNAPATTSTVTLANSIVSSNITNIAATIAKNDIATGVALDPVTTSASHSLLGLTLAASYPGNGNLFSDTPRLAPLHNYGGSTQTMAPLSGSLAIDAGDNTLAVDESANPLTTDQTGAARIVNAIVDMGAVEYADDEIFANGFDF